MTSFFAKRLCLALALFSASACSSSLPFGRGEESSAPSEEAGKIGVSRPEFSEAEPKVLGGKELSGIENFEITEAEAVASDETGAKLGLPPGVVSKGPSVRFGGLGEIPRETMDAVEFMIPYTGDLTENLVVLYRLPAAGEGEPRFGVIPLSYLKVDPILKTVTFKSRGLGDYQVAHTAEKVVRPLSSADTGLEKNPSDGLMNLNLLGTLDLAGAYGVDANETHAFVVGDPGLRVISLENPQAPTQVGATATGLRGQSAQLSGTTLIQVSSLGQSSFNIAAPTAPTLRTTVNDNAGSDLVVIGNSGFAATTAGVRALLFASGIISQRDLVAQTGGCNGGAGDTRIAAFACAGSVIGFTTNNLPLSAGFTIDNTTGGRAVAVSGNYVYVVGDDGLRIYDVTQPFAPRRVGALAFGMGRSVAVLGEVALVVTANSAQLVDVSNKTMPIFLQSSPSVPLMGGRRVRMIPGTTRGVILDSVGLKYIEIK